MVLKIIQNPEMFNFSLDSTLLGDYATLNKNAKSIVDLMEQEMTGSFILSLRSKNAHITGVEIQEMSYDLAQHVMWQSMVWKIVLRLFRVT